MDLNYREIISGHFHTKISSKLNDFDACDMQCYSESTADGYDVYVLKHTDAPVNLNEDVYYYGNDLAEQIMDAISEYRIDSIYIDENLYDDLYMDDAFEEYFNDNVDDIMDQDFKEFTQSERNFIHEEYDIEYM
jgi:hypothetical protein